MAELDALQQALRGVVDTAVATAGRGGQVQLCDILAQSQTAPASHEPAARHG
jgi:hypothetical protein